MILLYYLFEKLHAYYYKYCANSTNKIWGNHTPYKEANKGNKYAKYNECFAKLYKFLFPYFYKFRYKLTLYFPNKKEYKRYCSSKLKGLSDYEIKKYYNWHDKILLKYRVNQLNKQTIK